MVYECKDKYLSCGLISHNGFKLVKSEKINNEVYFYIEYKNKERLLKLLQDFLDYNLNVNLEKFNRSMSQIQDEISKYD